MSECNPSISCGFELEAAYLTGVDKIVFGDVELEAFHDYLLNEFSDSVEEDDGLEGFGTIISRLVRLGNDNHGRSFEMIVPMSQIDARIRNVDDVRHATV